MPKGTLIASAIAFAATVAVASVAAAQTGPGSSGSPTAATPSSMSASANVPLSAPNGRGPTWGRQFGAHVAGMAPEHPLDHGVMFGQCVSAMAVEAMSMGDDTMHDMCHAM